MNIEEISFGFFLVDYLVFLFFYVENYVFIFKLRIVVFIFFYF